MKGMLAMEPETKAPAQSAKQAAPDCADANEAAHDATPLRVRALEPLEAFLELGGTRKDIALLIVSAVALVLSFFFPQALPFDPAWIAIVLCGVPIVLEAIIGLVKSFDIKADVLVSLALIASVIIGEDFAAGEVAVIMQLGGLLEDLTVAKARAGIERLVHLTPRTARVLQTAGGETTEEIIPADDVRKNDVLRVLPGETVPVDGVILQGLTSIDESIMTGEPLPVDKAAGDKVKSGTVNQFGVFEMRAEQVGKDSSLARMIALVQSADAGKAQIVRLADRWATWIVVIALASALGTWLVTGEILRAVTILVVFCPCALVLATPTAIMAAIGNVTKFGVLVREGDALERLASVKRVTFDKTGTLTHGTPEVIAVVPFSPVHRHHEGCCDKEAIEAMDETRLFRIAAAVERLSEHPLGRAVVQGWQKRCESAREEADPQNDPSGNSPEKRAPAPLNLPEAADFSMTPGRGVSALVEGDRILAGNVDFMLENAVAGSLEMDARASSYVEQGCTTILVAKNGRAIGFLALADTLRSTSKETIAAIKSLGIIPVLLTGDHVQAARHISEQIGIEDVKADCLPEDKLAAIEAFEHEGKPVVMVGDGINDAPALKRATVGIAMGAIGSDIAVDAADIALVRDDISSLPHLMALSRRMMTTIKLNMTFSLALNFVAIILAMTGILNPVVGALVHNCGSVIVIINSAFLLSWKKK